jgi:hypothetical protein
VPVNLRSLRTPSPRRDLEKIEEGFFDFASRPEIKERDFRRKPVGTLRSE